jgi:release factor glutamine methyltransferase
VTLAEALKTAEARLERAGLPSAGTEASALLEVLLGASRSDLLLDRGRFLSATQEAELERWLARREAGEPLQHILGFAHFYGLSVQVTPDVLIPRPETETLVELGLTVLRGTLQPKVLDVGTGSGAVALAVKAERPDAEVWATDLSAAALRVASANVARLGLDIRFTRADLLSVADVEAFAREVVLLVSNPPYLPDADRAWLSPEVQRDPPEALFSGADGLEHFRRLSAQALPLLKPGAVCLLELDPRNVKQARAESRAWAEAVIYPDLAGRDRFLLLRR